MLTKKGVAPNKHMQNEVYFCLHNKHKKIETEGNDDNIRYTENTDGIDISDNISNQTSENTSDTKKDNEIFTILKKDTNELDDDLSNDDELEFL